VMFDMLVDFASDRWGGFQKDRHRLLKFITDNDIQNLYILSGDLHNAHCIETDLHGKNGPLKLWEFCSSPFEQQPNVASYTYIRPWDNLIKRQKLHARLVTQNFGVVKVDLTESSPRVKYEIHGQDGKVLYP
jgi:phosphodiesterase/alkaline phosphatase D-like protein